MHLNKSGYYKIAAEVYAHMTGKRLKVKTVKFPKEPRKKRRTVSKSRSMKEIVQPPFYSGHSSAKHSMNRVAQL